jgi:hypothetical protein
MLEQELRQAFEEVDRTARVLEYAELNEAEILVKVCAEIDPATGKPTYSNEALRKAEVLRRLLRCSEAYPLARVKYDVARARLDMLRCVARLAAQPVAVEV